MDGNPGHMTGDAVCFFEPVGMGRGAWMAGDALGDVESMIITDCIGVASVTSSASQLAGDETRTFHEPVRLEAHILQIVFLFGENAGAVTVSAEESLRLRIQFTGIQWHSTAERVTCRTGVAASAVYTGFDGFEILREATRGVAAEAALHGFGVQVKAQSGVSVGGSARGMPDSNSVTVDLRKVADS